MRQRFVRVAFIINSYSSEGREVMANLPPGMTQERWDKKLENSRRAERLTGVHPISGDGWETVCVLLMDLLEKEKEEKSG